MISHVFGLNNQLVEENVNGLQDMGFHRHHIFPRQ